MDAEIFKLQPNRWFAWQMLPGYEVDVPYFSPIFVYEVKPLKSGKGVLRVDFYNAFYAEGVRNFSLGLKVLKRSEDYLVGEILHHQDDAQDRVGIITRISFDWLTFVWPELLRNHPPMNLPVPESLDSYLDRVLERPQR